MVTWMKIRRGKLTYESDLRTALKIIFFSCFFFLTQSVCVSVVSCVIGKDRTEYFQFKKAKFLFSFFLAIFQVPKSVLVKVYIYRRCAQTILLGNRLRVTYKIYEYLL